MLDQNPDRLLHVLSETVLATVRRDSADLTARQLAVFLTSYLAKGPHTVRGLAAELNVSKPAITRALDRLGKLGLTRRATDPFDRRSVHVQQTPAGQTYLRDLKAAMSAAAGGAETQAAATAQAAVA
ncbi:MarR family transcriptional regulator [Siccirubricoccus deserti]|uniref:MarR family transcriptional regulator n=1 Tax=Siccirubricoccus deserti TaxID=2013562 RepID=A0A9X0R2H2_9PROT|nr:MarR family transcriptional regulator [Siccirubricoccus deserti]MBC4018376.1 MarR family transcriptional regulator [Siccirubricoccus deserti]GGC65108.1 MarR family transcriptional regulator [Siccirubricoccus deserti]